jgi:DNA-binding MarR family transcriptional regulator
MFLLVQQMTKRFQEILTPHGVTPLHWGILCCLWEEDGLRTTEIGKRLEQLGGTVTVGLDVMERDGLVQRKTDGSDGRILRIFLTERGASLRTTLAPAAAALIEDMFATLAPGEYHDLAKQIARLRQALSRPASTPKPQKPG